MINTKLLIDELHEFYIEYDRSDKIMALYNSYQYGKLKLLLYENKEYRLKITSLDTAYVTELYKDQITIEDSFSFDPLLVDLSSTEMRFQYNSLCSELSICSIEIIQALHKLISNTTPNYNRYRYDNILSIINGDKDYD